MHCYGLTKQLCSWASYIEKELQQKNQQLKLLRSLTAKLEKKTALLNYNMEFK